MNKLTLEPVQQLLVQHYQRQQYDERLERQFQQWQREQQQ